MSGLVALIDNVEDSFVYHGRVLISSGADFFNDRICVLVNRLVSCIELLVDLCCYVVQVAAFIFRCTCFG